MRNLTFILVGISSLFLLGGCINLDLRAESPKKKPVEEKSFEAREATRNNLLKTELEALVKLPPVKTYTVFNTNQFECSMEVFGVVNATGDILKGSVFTKTKNDYALEPLKEFPKAAGYIWVCHEDHIKNKLEIDEK